MRVNNFKRQHFQKSTNNCLAEFDEIKLYSTSVVITSVVIIIIILIKIFNNFYNFNKH